MVGLWSSVLGHVESRCQGDVQMGVLVGTWIHENLTQQGDLGCESGWGPTERWELKPQQWTSSWGGWGEEEESDREGRFPVDKTVNSITSSERSGRKGASTGFNKREVIGNFHKESSHWRHGTKQDGREVRDKEVVRE